MPNAKFNITPLALPPLSSLTPPMTVISSVSLMKWTGIFHVNNKPLTNQIFQSPVDSVKLILHLWHSKFHLSILINRMTSPQNCSYRKPTTVMLTLHLWQTTVMLLWQLLSSGFHIEAETSDAKFNIIPLASNSLLSSTIHLWQWLSLELSYQSRDDQC